ncbi:hypothetical protein BD94_1565 [Elizabethkingia anophelis NUHP1]|uniref:Uncharacterized protein n=1 Tax=Elizabethkingia anophelis NUHP1 TaxID=1338011 RepID=A0A077EIG8_9FLAO|nr:hypothetical protein BD94_1565 [Elizabethkingia anophelis NUHP1]
MKTLHFNQSFGSIKIDIRHNINSSFIRFDFFMAGTDGEKKKQVWKY